MQQLRVNNPGLDKNMVRAGENGAFDLFNSQSSAPTGIVTEELRQRAFTSIGRDVKVPVIDYNGSVTISNTRSCVIPDNDNTSHLVTLVFANFSTGFSMLPARYNTNEITYQRDWERKMSNVIRALGDALDVQAIATLEANKSTIYKNALGYTMAGGSVQVPFVKRGNIFGDLNAMMRANRFSPIGLHVVGNPGVMSVVRNLAQHDIYNDTNKRNEWGDKVFHYTDNLTDGDTIMGTLYAVADGNLGCVTRVAREEYMGTISRVGHEWGTVMLPGLNIMVGTHEKEEVGDFHDIDGEASSDMVCNLKKYYGFSFDICFMVAYNSDPATIPNPIIKAEFINEAAMPTMAQPVYVVNTVSTDAIETVNP